jgi:DNA-binding Xre family transcriptional regulator
MVVNYNKLWKILEERQMLKTDLVKAAKISTNAMAKLGKNQDVRMGILINICKTLDCKIDDIIEY